LRYATPALAPVPTLSENHPPSANQDCLQLFSLSAVAVGLSE
jgi:hypothetical protein